MDIDTVIKNRLTDVRRLEAVLDTKIRELKLDYNKLFNAQQELLRAQLEKQKEELGILGFDFNAIWRLASNKLAETPECIDNFLPYTDLITQIRREAYKHYYYGIGNDEALVLRILTSKTADEALNYSAVPEKHRMYDFIRKTVLDTCFEILKSDLSDLC